MLTPDRTTVKNALLNLGAAATFSTPINGFSTWANASAPTRRLKMFDKVDKSVQPAMFLTQHREEYEAVHGGDLQRRYLDMQFWCYAPSGDPDSGIVGDTLLDIMESALETQLQPDDPLRYELTLGGLLSTTGWVRIMRKDNLFIRDPGDVDGQALLILPVRVLLP